MMFMTASQFGLDATDVQREADWRPIMRLILTEADLASDDMERLKIEIRDRLMETVILTGNVPSVNIFDEPYFPRPKGHMKRIAISLYDRNNTMVDFCLAKRHILKSLKDLSLAVVNEQVKHGVDITDLELPESLKKTLRKEFYKCWARKRFPSYSISMLPCKEALKRKKELSDIEMKEARARRCNISLHRVI